ncbi:MAG: tRNA-dihydrouridine synthase [Candidatus Ancillula sp.]|nr:tRNA-dihydrouridine synthase [Candidatus Ancillula sp.]
MVLNKATTNKRLNFAGRSFLPVMLAPMAGVTDVVYRRICRTFARSGMQGAQVEDALEPGLFVNEMVAARAISGRISTARRHLVFDSSETFRSMQLYPLDAYYAGEAAKIVSGENLADHIDINFGCPVRKVTANGGGSAICWKLDLYREIISAIVQNAGDLPVTAKFRIGLDDERITYHEAGLIAAELGCKAVTLHARTTKQYYSGTANWEHIGTLKSELTSVFGDLVQVFGNGDIWGVEDAKKMLELTSADGVCIGRGAYGRPWIFKELAEFFTTGKVTPFRPTLGEVAQIMLEHLRELISYIQEHDEKKYAHEQLACKYFRSFIAPYLKGFPIGSSAKVQLMSATSYYELAVYLENLPQNLEYPVRIENKPRGRTKGTARVFLPQGWLDSRTVLDN